MSRALAFLLLFPLLLVSCGRGGDQPRPGTTARPTISPAAYRACLADLTAMGVEFQPLPDRQFGGGCSANASVKLLDIGVPVTNLGAMQCPLARTFAAWARNGVMPAARLILQSEVVRIESMGTYACRAVTGGAPTTRLSEHASANAVDVGAFVLADGRRISVKNGWSAPEADRREFLRTVHRSGCRRFATVLSPDYNAAHHDHLHLDMGRGPFCR